jgi:mannose-6-phosphate isomerase
VLRLNAPVRHYAWGSRSHIPRLCGGEIGDEPVAEMWFGAHPTDPSRSPDGKGLDRLIADDPVKLLGKKVTTAFGARLPFMMKLLAAAEPLSLQVHPSSEQARIRFAEQNAAGIPVDADDRSYRDASHKPELVFALTRFEGMAGFRQLDSSSRILREFRLPWLDRLADELGETVTPFQTLRRAVTDMLATKGPDLTARLRELRCAAVRAEARWHVPSAHFRPPEVAASSIERESLRVFAQTASLVDRYPEDPGVLVTLLLNHLVLAAGEAMFIDEGVMHAYTSGLGVEVMATSDNVLRAGLTPKHVDIPELLEVTDFTPIPPPRWTGSRLSEVDGVVLAPPVEEFELVVADIADGDELTFEEQPLIVLGLSGATVVVAGQVQERLRPGESVFVTASDGPSRLLGSGRVAVARCPNHS